LLNDIREKHKIVSTVIMFNARTGNLRGLIIAVFAKPVFWGLTITALGLGTV
jgi:hypothetical protein